ncbi:ABC transporter permease [Brevibacillus sp. B_LB10_24]|uniref:ABC transporter permease n=1 Tax=Brevibacillus sp. B_LB10_24 TaxID=3380645 RepID=UPI0038BC7394
MLEVKRESPIQLKKESRYHKLMGIPGLQWLLLLIPLAYVLFFMVFSMIGLFKLSVYDESGFTLRYLAHFFLQKVYMQVIWLTFKIAFLVTFFTLILSYPVAYLLVKIESPRWKKLIFGAILIPFWISLLVRTFTWTILLQDQGVINKFLMTIGLIDQPLPLLFNTTGVVIGMVHVLLPYMVLNLFAVMQGIDERLPQAAQGLGARPWQAFLQVFFPLSLPGVFSGSLLVFVLSLGYFITPALLGGPKNIMVSMLIQDNVSTTLNWHLASTIALVLFVVTLLLLFASFLITRNNPVWKELT